MLPNLTRASTLLRDTVTSMQGRGTETLANFQTLLQNAGFVGPRLAEITPTLLEFGPAVTRLWWGPTRIVTDTGAPESMRNFGRFLARFQNFEDTRAPDIKVIAQAFMPYIQGIAAALMNFDTGQILSNMLAAVPEDGTITLHVTTPGPP